MLSEDIDITKTVNIIPMEDATLQIMNHHMKKCISGNTIFDNNDNKLKYVVIKYNVQMVCILQKLTTI